MSENDESEKLVELAKRRGFFFPSAQVYGGVAGFYTFGPQGSTLKQKIEDIWRDRFTFQEGNKEIDAPTVMPEPVFEASGHLEGFDDMIVVCEECGASHRADHLVEDSTGIEDAESLSAEEVAELIAENDIRCPSCGSPLAGQEVEDFNLMFGTSIGPGDSTPGYLRPETAQGIFVEFPQLREYAREQLPFGVTQVGRAYRNEISPRKSIIRVREFTQAELELFIDPEENEPELEKIEDLELELYPVTEQENEDSNHVEMSIREAVDQDVIESDWVAYYLGIAKRWFERIGVDMDRFRFRQHLSGERAHYASDCWDAEAELDGDWVELAGFAYRGCYDLSKHEEHSDEDFRVFKEYDEPKMEEEVEVRPNMESLGPEFGDRAGEVAEALKELGERNPEALQESGNVTVEVNEEEMEIDKDTVELNVEEVKKTGERITPHVVEPSFGIGRILYTVMAHSYDEDEVDGEERKVLRFEPEVAPTEAAVFPLMDKQGMGETARELAEQLRKSGLSVSYDDSGSIGRRYRRQDEVGTPFCLTVDHETLDDSTVTVRDRDSTEQVRIAVEELPGVLEDLVSGQESFQSLE